MYQLKKNLSKTKVLNLLKSQEGGRFKNLAFSDFCFRKYGPQMYMLSFSDDGVHYEMWLHHWYGRIGYRLDGWCFVDEYDDQMTQCSSQFCHVDLDTMISLGLVEEVA